MSAASEEEKIDLCRFVAKWTQTTGQTLIAVNDSFIVYGYTYKKQIDIYDVNDFRLKKKDNGW